MTENKTSQDKNSSAMPVIIAVLVVLAVIIIAGLYASSQKSQESVSQITSVEEKPLEEITKVMQNEPYQPRIPVVTSKLNDTPFSARIMGNPDAPLKISEHSSFTCSHCRSFHEGNFIKIKKDYIETGKAYMVFNDFPRNPLDMHIGSVARCLSDEVYFNFVQLMFETQNDWMKANKYMDYIKQNTRMLGLTPEKIDECLNNKDIQKSISGNQEQVFNTHKVKSTPTLVLNDSTVIPGLSPYDELKKTFDKLIAEKENSTE